MDIVLIIIRVASLLTFLLLIAEGVIGIILAKRAVRVYVKKHQELEARVDSIERRLASMGN